MFNIQEGGVDQLKSELRTTMEKELKNALRVINKKVVMEQLFKLNKFDMPNALIESEIDGFARRAQERVKRDDAKKRSPKSIVKHFAKKRRGVFRWV